ncbi:dihydrolipoamide acetyltransferase family protein [Salipiger mangrovisoli]|uniref:Dihydrolipoamide acetyltransferase component of pyruvate dehydrogenase complex n=1 Tax=Salipiger mangrovisoli TaxID=2865933 RepID=A0ABR9X9P9_9RHOB|nr:dihydrolipoamide acetyltransferase family protein [Salipiger mangrovisoli]MBE9640199.1 2-oxo acid dehydrogenase subunit E2 [Salipiger mangrovisoli]
MPKDITLPSLSAGMEDGLIARWLVNEGDVVAKGDLLAEIETDKATMELEADGEGRVGKILVGEGDRADVNQVILVLLGEGEDAASIVTQTTVEASAQPAPDVPAAVDPAPPAKNGSKIKASPLARRLADMKGIPLEGLAGSGPQGRIVRVDVLRAAEQPVPAAAAVPGVLESPAPAIPPGIGTYEEIPHSGMRRTIARRLVESKTTVPHFYLEADCDLEALLTLREQVNADRAREDRISVNDFIIKAVAHAMAKVPGVNAIWTEEAVLKLNSIDISVAVATEGGLITPVVRGADRLSLGSVSSEMKALVAKARDGKLKPEEYQGGGFSISNLGMFGVKKFSAIINPPQSCILAVGAAERRPVGRGDQIVLAPVMSVTLSVDHRSVDGALGAEWLAAFKSAIEAPMSLLV